MRIIPLNMHFIIRKELLENKDKEEQPISRDGAVGEVRDFLVKQLRLIRSLEEYLNGNTNYQKVFRGSVMMLENMGCLVRPILGLFK